MNCQKRTKKSLLTALICLSLSGTTFAMPAGGTVASGTGTVVGLTDGTVASGGTINVPGAPGIINWNSFSIGTNETLNFVINSALLNRVTGAEASELLGHLISSGGALLLVNPNGIVVGPNAVINANQLLMSTLNITDSEFAKLCKGGIGATFTKGNSTAATAGLVNIQNGSQITVNDLLHIYGGKIQIADGVTISANNQNTNPEADISLVAADQISYLRPTGNDVSVLDTTRSFSTTMTKDNTIAIGDGTGTTQAKVDNNGSQLVLDVIGGNINITNAHISVDNKRDDGKYTGELYAVAGKSFKNGSYAGAVTKSSSPVVVQAGTDNGITVQSTGTDKTKYTGITTGKALWLAGGTVDVEKSGLQSDDGSIHLMAAPGTSVTSNGPGNISGMSTDNALTIANSTIGVTTAGAAAGNEVGITGIGGKVAVNGSTLSGDGIEFMAATSGTVGRNSLSLTMNAGNTIAMQNTSIQAADGITLTGAAVNLDAASLKGASGISIGAGKNITLDMGKIDDTYDAPRILNLTATNANTLTLSGKSTADANLFLYLYGGKVNAIDSTISTGNGTANHDADMALVAANSITYTKPAANGNLQDHGLTTAMTKDNLVNINGTTIKDTMTTTANGQSTEGVGSNVVLDVVGGNVNVTHGASIALDNTYTVNGGTSSAETKHAGEAYVFAGTGFTKSSTVDRYANVTSRASMASNSAQEIDLSDSSVIAGKNVVLAGGAVGVSGTSTKVQTRSGDVKLLAVNGFSETNGDLGTISGNTAANTLNVDGAAIGVTEAGKSEGNKVGIQGIGGLVTVDGAALTGDGVSLLAVNYGSMNGSGTMLTLSSRSENALTLTDTNIAATDGITLFGSNVNLANTGSFLDTLKSGSGISIGAGRSAVLDANGLSDKTSGEHYDANRILSLTADGTNVVSVDKQDLDANMFLYLYGGALDVSNSKMSTGNNSAYHDADMALIAANSITFTKPADSADVNDTGLRTSMAAGNTLNLTKTTISDNMTGGAAKGSSLVLNVIGGNVNVAGSTIGVESTNSNNDAVGEAFVVAGTGFTKTAGNNASVSYTSTAAQGITYTGKSLITAGDKAILAGGNLTVKDASVQVENGDIDLLAVNSFTLGANVNRFSSSAANTMDVRKAVIGGPTTANKVGITGIGGAVTFKDSALTGDGVSLAAISSSNVTTVTNTKLATTNTTNTMGTGTGNALALDGTKVTASDGIEMYGASVSIADGEVTSGSGITTGAGSSMIVDLNGVSDVTSTVGDVGRITSLTANTTNGITVNGASKLNSNAFLYMYGGKLDVDGATMSTGNSSMYHNADMALVAANSVTYTKPVSGANVNDTGYRTSMAAGNTLNLNKTTIKNSMTQTSGNTTDETAGSDLTLNIIGGNVNIADGTLTVANSANAAKGKAFIVAGSSFTNPVGTSALTTYTSSAAQGLSYTDTNLVAGDQIFLAGGSLTMKNGIAQTAAGDVKLLALNSYNGTDTSVKDRNQIVTETQITRFSGSAQNTMNVSDVTIGVSDAGKAAGNKVGVTGMGGSVTLKGSTLTGDGINLAAVSSGTYQAVTVNGIPTAVTETLGTAAGTALTLDGTVVSASDGIEMYGANVNIDKGLLTSSSGITVGAGSSMAVDLNGVYDEGSKLGDAGRITYLTANTANGVVVDETSKLNSNYFLYVYGGKLDIDGAKMSTGNNSAYHDADMALIAANSITFTKPANSAHVNDTGLKTSMAAGNTLNLTKTDISDNMSGGADKGSNLVVNVVGGNVNVAGSTIAVESTDTSNKAAGEAFIVAGTGFSKTANSKTSAAYTSTANQGLNYTDTTLTAGDQIILAGGTLNAKNAEAQVTTGDVKLLAVNSFNGPDTSVTDRKGNVTETQVTRFSGSAANTMNVNGAMIGVTDAGKAAGNKVGITGMGGAITLKDATLAGDGIDLAAISSGTYTTVAVNGDTPTTTATMGTAAGTALTLDGTTVTAGDGIELYGANVNVHGGNLNSASGIMMGAGSNMAVDLNGVYDAATSNKIGDVGRITSLTAGPANGIVVDDTAQMDSNAFLYMYGGKVSVDAATVSTGNNASSHDADMVLLAANSMTFTMPTDGMIQHQGLKAAMTAGNTVNISDSTLSESDGSSKPGSNLALKVIGGNVRMDNAKIDAVQTNNGTEQGRVVLFAGNSAASTYTTTDGQTSQSSITRSALGQGVDIEGSTIASGSETDVIGSTVNVAGSTLTARDEVDFYATNSHTDGTGFSNLSGMSAANRLSLDRTTVMKNGGGVIYIYGFGGSVGVSRSVLTGNDVKLLALSSWTKLDSAGVLKAYSAARTSTSYTDTIKDSIQYGFNQATIAGNDVSITNGTTVTASNDIMMAGAKVNIDHSKTTAEGQFMTAAGSNILLAATQNASLDTDVVHALSATVAGAANGITFQHAEVTGGNNVSAAAGTISAADSKLSLAGKNFLGSEGEIDLIAANAMSIVASSDGSMQDNHVTTTTTNAQNTISLDHVTVTNNDITDSGMRVLGGTVNMKDADVTLTRSSATAKGDGVDSTDTTKEQRGGFYTGGFAGGVTMTGSNVTVGDAIIVAGPTVDLENSSTLTTKATNGDHKGAIQIMAGRSFGTQGGAIFDGVTVSGNTVANSVTIDGGTINAAGSMNLLAGSVMMNGNAINSGNGDAYRVNIGVGNVITWNSTSGMSVSKFNKGDVYVNYGVKLDGASSESGLITLEDGVVKYAKVV